jgi:hypothetical protein
MNCKAGERIRLNAGVGASDLAASPLRLLGRSVSIPRAGLCVRRIQLRRGAPRLHRPTEDDFDALPDGELLSCSRSVMAQSRTYTPASLARHAMAKPSTRGFQTHRLSSAFRGTRCGWPPGAASDQGPVASPNRQSLVFIHGRGRPF